MKTLHIKNMVCPRCIESVEQSLHASELEPVSVSLGEVVLITEPEAEQLNQLSQNLADKGFLLLTDPQTSLAESIKSELINYLSEIENGSDTGNYSEWLSGRLHKNYSYLSNLFSRSEGITIEQYFIRLRTERAKELIEAGDQSISQIALQLGYSSSQYFANQFRDVTGKTPSSWKKNPGRRIGLERV